MSDPPVAPWQSEPLQTPGEEFLRRVKRAGKSVLGESDTGKQVSNLCDDHQRTMRLIGQDRSSGALVLAIVGATGQGKSWLVRQLIRRSAVASTIRSGNNLDQTTEQLVWVGPSPPADLDSRFEQYVAVSAADMEPLGAPYLLVDAPGATDDRPAIVDVARRALSLASALVLVVRRDQIRGQTPGILAVASEGTIVIPVINAVPHRDSDDELDPELNADVDAFLANLRTVAPGSIIQRPILVDDFEIGKRGESEIAEQTTGRLMRTLQSALEAHPDSDRRKTARLAALDERFRSALSGLLTDELPGLSLAVNRLNAEATKLPGAVAQTLIGNDGPLQAVVRSRLRLALLTATGAIWFPYRSILGVLNLTHGAWDRVLLSLSGSLPSLISTVWTSTKSLTSQRGANDELRDGLQRRAAAAVTDRLGPLATQFRDELARLRTNETTPSSSGSQRDPIDANLLTDAGQVASLGGLDALQERSQQIVDESIEDVSIRSSSAFALALVGTAIFWILMAGPFFSLYSEYLGASYDALSGGEATMKHFPHPEFGMVATSLVLSLLPTAIFSMIALSIAQSNAKVRGAVRKIRVEHDQAIEKLQSDGVLRLRWDDPLLRDAEFLVSAGNIQEIRRGM